MWIFVNKNSFNMPRSPLTVMAFACSFSKKNDPIMPLDQNPQLTVTRFGCVGFSMYAFGFSVSQMRQFCLFGGRIKLIICQIRHKLSVTIHEISTSWKNVKWRTIYKLLDTNLNMFNRFQLLTYSLTQCSRKKRSSRSVKKSFMIQYCG